jgi:hypothetical protein
VNAAEKKLAVQVGKNMLIFMGVKLVVLYGMARILRKAAEEAS